MRPFFRRVVFGWLAANAGLVAQDLAQVQPLLDRATAAADLNDGKAALEHLTAALDRLDQADPDCKQPDALKLRWSLGRIANQLGASAQQLQAWRGVLLHLGSRELGPDKSEALDQLQYARDSCALASLRLKRFDEAIGLRETIFAAWQKADAPIRAADARYKLGRTLLDSGKVERALTELEQAHAAMAATNPGAFHLAWMKRNYASALGDAGDYWNPALQRLQEQALALWQTIPAAEREEPAHSEFVVGIGWELASTLLEVGDFVRARKTAQDALALAVSKFGGNSDQATWPRGVLATIDINLGDFETGVKLLAENLAVRQELQPDAFDLQMVRLNHGFALMMAGRPQEAVPGFEAAIAVLGRNDLRDPFHIETLGKLYDNLSICHLEADKLELAEEAGRKAVERNHDQVAIAQAKGSLAWILHRRGKFQEAEQLYVEALPDVIRTQRHRQPCQYLEQRALNYVALRAPDKLQSCLEELLAEAAKTVDECHRLPGRGSYELAKVADRAAQAVLALDQKLPKKVALDLSAFAMLETLRGIELRATNQAARLAGLPEVGKLLDKAQAARAELARLASTGATGDAFAKCQEKERSEFDTLYQAMKAAGMPRVDVTVAAVAAKLPKDAAAIAFRRMHLVGVDPKQPNRDASQDRLEAHVVTADRKLRRVDLGDAAAIAKAAKTWRDAIEGGEERSPGRPMDEKRDDPAKALDGLLFGKGLVEAIGSSKRLIVCLDDVLHTVPIEVLPAAGKHSIEFVGSLADLIAPPPPVTAKATMFATGDLDYDQAPDEQAAPAADRPAVGAVAPPLERSSNLGDFGRLSCTRQEIRQITESFQRRFDTGALVRAGRTATRDEVRRQAQSARFLHFATHGYFLREGPADGAGLRNYEAIRGFAPMALCGLALSGANLTGKDEAQGFLGVVTGEEIAAMNLSQCELAVLSACQSYLGESRRGHGLASLQAAFHAAGARYVIATRWRVDDERAAQFMAFFYRGLWDKMELKMSPWKALEFARTEMRRETKQVKHWAAFVLTGPVDG